MKLSSLFAAFAMTLVVAVGANAQSRDFRSERLILDDDMGNTITLETPTGPITGGTLLLPDPAGSTNTLLTTDVSGNTTLDGSIRLVETGGGTDYVGFQAPTTISSSQIWTLPAADGTSGQVLTTDGAGVLSWSTAGGGTVTHNATLTGAGTVGSPLGINLGNANTWTANQTFAGTFLITSNSRIAMTNSDNNARDIRLQEPSGTGTQYIGIRAPSVTNNGNYVWPAVVGSAGQVMTIASTNGIDSATLSWTTVAGGTVTADSTLIGNGTGGSPLGLDLAQSNVWTATISTFSGFLESRNEPFVITNTDNVANEMRIQEASGNGSNYFAIRADTSITTNDVWIMPSDAPVAGDVLTVTAVNTPSNRFATLEWSAPAAPSQVNFAYTGGVTGTYNATSSNSIIGVTTSGGAVTVNLPTAASAGAGRMMIIKDETGQANTNNITVSRAGTDTVEGGTSLTINTVRGRLILYSDGVSAWYRAN